MMLDCSWLHNVFAERINECTAICIGFFMCLDLGLGFGNYGVITTPRCPKALIMIPTFRHPWFPSFDS